MSNAGPGYNVCVILVVFSFLMGVCVRVGGFCSY
jgi:hypothetical protein